MLHKKVASFILFLEKYKGSLVKGAVREGD